MADYVPGVPQQPILITIDGNGFLVIRSNSKVNKGVQSKEIVMSPLDWTKSKLNITDEQLDFSDRGDVYGALTRVYPAANVLPLSDNPEKPIWLLTCGFNGEQVNIDNPTLFPIIKIVESNKTKDKRIELLEAERDKLRDDNRKLVLLTSEYRDKMRDIFGDKSLIPLPEELLGMKIGKEGVKR